MSYSYWKYTRENYRRSYFEKYHQDSRVSDTRLNGIIEDSRSMNTLDYRLVDDFVLEKMREADLAKGKMK